VARSGDEEPGSFLDRSPLVHGLLIAATALLQVSAGVGMAYLAGFHRVWVVLGRFDWVWLLGLLGGLAVSFVGYYYAYVGLYVVDDGPSLPDRDLRAVVVAGFSGFLAHTGAEVDHYALRRAGADERESKVRVWALGGMEHGILSILGTVAAIIVLAQGFTVPPLDVTLPWAVIPVPGFLIAFFLAERYRDRFRRSGGWKGSLGVFLDCIHLIRQMFRHVDRYWFALGGMALFWLADGFAAWCGLACFGYQLNGARFAVGLATGALFTRRTGPLAGAGVLMVVLPLTLWYSGAPLDVAVVGIFVFRVLSVWLPMPLSLASLRVFKRLGRRRRGRAGQAGEEGAGASRRSAQSAA
jgi:hypothetical protein